MNKIWVASRGHLRCRLRLATGELQVPAKAVGRPIIVVDRIHSLASPACYWSFWTPDGLIGSQWAETLPYWEWFHLLVDRTPEDPPSSDSLEIMLTANETTRQNHDAARLCGECCSGGNLRLLICFNIIHTDHEVRTRPQPGSQCLSVSQCLNLIRLTMSQNSYLIRIITVFPEESAIRPDPQSRTALTSPQPH